MLTFIRTELRMIAVLVFVVVAGRMALAQTTGSITGVVTDTSHSSIPGVAVSLSNAGTGTNLTTVSDAVGNFQFLLLPPGNYELRAEAKGFKAFRRGELVVEADRSQAIAVELAVGDTSQTVEVQSGQVLLEANSVEVGTVMDTTKIADLPLLSRNPLELANLTPTVRGISLFGGPVTLSSFSGEVDIGGGPPISNGSLIDGNPNDKIGSAAGMMTFLVADDTQEFKVLTSVFSAEYGRAAGGILSVISKSGTNAYHGTAYDYLRNTVFEANDFFSNETGAPRQTEKINQYGGTIGGPVKKDKLFFFYNYEGYKERRTFNRLNTAPTLLQKEGNFSDTYAANGQMIQIYDPLTTVASGSGYVRTPFPGNTIPASRQNAFAQNILNLFPLPNTQGNPLTGANNLVQTGYAPMNRFNTGLKMDYYLSATQRLAVRFTKDNFNYTYPNYYHNVLEYNGNFETVPRDSVSIQYTNTLSPTLLLDVALGYNHDDEVAYGPYSQSAYGCSDGAKPISSATCAAVNPVNLGLPAYVVAEQQRGPFTPNGSFPYLTISDIATCSGCNNRIGASSDSYRAGADPAGSVALHNIRGAHTLSFGFQTVMYLDNEGGVGQLNFAFDRGPTQGPNPLASSSTAGYGPASFLLGDTSSSTSSNQPYASYNTYGQHFYALFVQDDWKVSHKLTLNLGLRWEYQQPMTDRHGVLTNLDLADASPLDVIPSLSSLDLKGFASYPANTPGGSRGLYNSDYLHFGPRVGFAYQVTSKLVARSGYGINFVPFKGESPGPLPATGFSVTNQMVSSINGGLTPYNTLANPWPNGIQYPTNASLGPLTGIGSNLQGQVRNSVPGYIQQWNFSLQYQPWNNWLVETAYLGSRGLGLVTAQNINYDQIAPQYLKLGSQLNASVPNPFYGIISSGTLSNPTTTEEQLLLPYPQYLSVTGDSGFLGSSNYNAFTLKVEKRLSQGFSILISYTMSKLLDEAVGPGVSYRGVGPGAVATDPDTPILNWYDLAAEYSKSIDDIPQRMVLTGMWELPLGKNVRGWEHGVVGGWHLNAISTLQSGQTIALQSTSSNRPNVVPGVNDSLPVSTLAKWFNTAAYTAAAPFTYGNASRTMPNVQGPGILDVDLSLFKDFTIKERYILQFKANAFNLFNTPAFNVPGNDVTSASFGVVSAVTNSPGPRELQFALRLNF